MKANYQYSQTNT